MFKNIPLALALLLVFFAPSTCEDAKSHSIAQAIVYHLERTAP